MTVDVRRPLTLAPRLVPRPWGSENWLADGSSVVTGGPLDGATLSDLCRRFGAELLGEASVARYGPRMALLIKVLDAREDLSVQVHPDDAYALEHEAHTGHLGKAEAWYVLDTTEGAAVLRGFVRDVTPAEVRAAAADGSLPGLMRRIPVGRGDVVVNPAGTVHAILGGTSLYEVQQSSDLTYRLFDHGRVDASGAPRELHLDKALAVADLSHAPASLPAPPASPAPGVDGWRRLVSLPEFELDMVTLGRGDRDESCDEGQRSGAVLAGETSPASCQLLTLVDGSVELVVSTERFALPTLGATLLPANLGAYELVGAGQVLRAAVD